MRDARGEAKADPHVGSIGSLGWLRWIVQAHATSCALAVLLQGLTSLSAMALPWALSQVVRVMLSSREMPSVGRDVALLPEGLWLAVLGFAVLVGAEAFLSRGAETIQTRIRPHMRLMAAERLYAHLQGHSHHYFSEHLAGSLAQRVGETAQATSQVVWSLIAEIWPMAVVVISALGVLLTVSGALGIFFLVWVVLWLLVSWRWARQTQRFAYRGAQARSATSGALVDTVVNQAQVRLFAREAAERERLASLQSKELGIVQEANRQALRLRWLQHGFAAVLKIVVLTYAVHEWILGQAGLAAFVLLTSLSFVVIHETRQLGRRLQDVMEAAGQMAAGLAQLLTPHEVTDRPGALALGNLIGRIEFKDVWFGYRLQQPVFRGLSVCLEAGQRVGLVGYSGSGKSTFVNLLLRLYDVQAGCVRIDGWDVRDVTQRSLRANVAVVPQDPMLFHRSMRENLTYGVGEASDEEIQRCAEQAMAWDFISDLPGGLAAQVGERGVKLSGGQRQRVALTRALMKTAPIMILDEATSSLDAVTECAVQAALDEGLRGCTVIVVAHRLSTVAHLDRILVFDAGTVVEDGSHASLLERGGLYARLWRQQHDGFFPQSAL